MKVGKAGESCHSFISLGVVFHGTGTERIEMRVHRHVERGKIGEVPYHIGFRDLRQGKWLERSGCCRDQLLQGDGWYVTFRYPGTPAARSR